MDDDHRLWTRDWAWFGGLTSALAPMAVTPLVPDVWRCALVAAALGATSGAAVGLGLRSVLGLFPERSRVALALVAAPLPLGTWGAVVAGTSAALTFPDVVGLAAPCGSIAAAVQVAWFAPLYALGARRGWRRWRIVALAALGAPVGGLLAAAIVLAFVLPLA